MLIERVELPDLQTEEEISGFDSGVKMPSGGDMAVIGLQTETFSLKTVAIEYI